MKKTIMFAQVELPCELEDVKNIISIDYDPLTFNTKSFCKEALQLTESDDQYEPMMSIIKDEGPLSVIIVTDKKLLSGYSFNFKVDENIDKISNNMFKEALKRTNQKYENSKFKKIKEDD